MNVQLEQAPKMYHNLRKLLVSGKFLMPSTKPSAPYRIRKCSISQEELRGPVSTSMMRPDNQSLGHHITTLPLEMSKNLLSSEAVVNRKKV